MNEPETWAGEQHPFQQVSLCMRALDEWLSFERYNPWYGLEPIRREDVLRYAQSEEQCDYDPTYGSPLVLDQAYEYHCRRTAAMLRRLDEPHDHEVAFDVGYQHLDEWDWPVLDGNHRLLAHHFAGRTTVVASLYGGEAACAEALRLYGQKNR